MKRIFAAVFSALLLAVMAKGQPAGTYVNTAHVEAPPDPFPVVDATNFVNENLFEVYSGDFYTFSDVVNFTNLNVMEADGFTFDTEPASQGVNHPAANFVNGSQASTNLDNTLILAGRPNGGNAAGIVEIYATNIINRGTIEAAPNGLIDMEGNNVDVSRSVLALGTLINRTTVDPDGMVDNFWGFGTNQWNTAINLSPTNPTTGNFMMTNIADIGVAGAQTNFDITFVSTNRPPRQFTAVEMLILTNSAIFGTNRSDQIVFLENPNTNMLHTSIFFSGNTGFQLGTVIVQISANPYTNLLGDVITNTLYLVDSFGNFQTNGVITNFNVNEGITLNAPGGTYVSPQIYTFEPDSFQLLYTPPGALATATNGTVYTGHPNDNYSTLVPGNTTTMNFSFWGTNLVAGAGATPTIISNSFAAYDIGLDNTTWPLPPAGPPNQTLQQEVRELPGRIELHSSGSLNMNFTRVQGLNYVLFGATNEFVGSTNAAVSASYADMTLGSTNGTLTVSNLFQPLVPRYTGNIEIYSGVWSNLFATGVSNGGGFIFATNFAAAVNEALFVDLDGLSPDSDSTVLDMNLRSTTTNGQPGQVVIGDNLDNIEGNFDVNAGSLVVESNATLGLNPADITDTQYWNDGVPSLNSFTNYGTIFGPNTMYFEDSALAPDGSNLPYVNWVNEPSGFISDEGTVVSANLVENFGRISSDTGPTFITASNTVLIGTAAPFSSMAYWANPAAYQTNVNVNIVTASADISITSTNLIMTNQFLNPGRALDLNVSGTLSAGTNFFLVNAGINTGAVPTNGDFSLVTVVDSVVPYSAVNNSWAGLDQGPVASGFTNNLALGRLVLDGGPNSAMNFQGSDSANHALYVGVLELRNNFTNVDSGGNLVNVSLSPGMKIYYTTAYSWINGVTAAPVTTNLMGKNFGAFEQVPHDGVIHTSAEPVSFSGVSGYTTYDFGLTVTVAATPSPAASVSWNTIAGAENYLYYKNGLGGAWQLLTNFVSSSTGQVSVQDTPGESTRFYQVIASGP